MKKVFGLFIAGLLLSAVFVGCSAPADAGTGTDAGKTDAKPTEGSMGGEAPKTEAGH